MIYIDKLKQILKLIEENHIDIYFNITKEEIDKCVEELLEENKINNEYDLYYYTNVIIKKIFGRFDSHTRLVWNNADFKLPIRFKYINDKLYVIRTDNQNKDLLYGQILKINDIDINQLINEIDKMTAYSTNEFLQTQIENILYNGLKLRSLPSINSNSDEFKFEILKNDKIIIRTLKKQTDELTDLNKPKQNYSYEILNDMIYVVYNRCFEEHDNQMINFVKKIKVLSEEINIDKFVVDIRGNTGGNAEIIKPLIDFLKDKKVVTLVDKYIFSGGRFAILDLKNIDSKFVGSRIGTSLNCFGNVSSIKYDNFIIPISNKYFYIDTTYKYENYKYADTKEKFTELKKDKSLFIPQIFEPDYYCIKTIEDYKDGRDSELELAIKLMEDKKIK